MEIHKGTTKKLSFFNRKNHLLLEKIAYGFDCNEYLKKLLKEEICNKIEIDTIREGCLYIIASEQIRKRLSIIDEFLYFLKMFERESALLNRHSTLRKINRTLGGLVDENLMEKNESVIFEPFTR